MDTATPAPLPTEPAPRDEPPTRRVGIRARSDAAEQPRLPLGEEAEGPGGAVTGAGQDDDHDRPIGFALTARARRVVAPDSLPDLAVVPSRSVPADGGAELPDDTRPARARALRRAGVAIARIADQLDADPLVVTAWTGEVAVRVHRPGRRVEVPPAPSTPTPTANADTQGSGQAGPDGAEDADEATGRELARAAATLRARQRLDDDPAFALAAGLLAAVAEVDAHAVTVATDDARIARRAMQALSGEMEGARELARLVVRVGPGAAGDLVRHRVAAEVGVEVAQVTWTRWRGAPRADGVRILLRVADPGLADEVAGMTEAVLDPAPCPAGEPF
jgi:hypothetical protein